MANTPVVAVGRPDGLGWRHVTINDHPAGQVRSMGELRRLIRGAGLVSGYDIHWIGEDCTVWPDCPWYRRTVGTLMAAGLLATACMLFKIGMKDTLNALTYSGRITGIIFLLAFLLEIIAAAAAVDYWHKRKMAYSGMIILMGALVSLAVSLLLLIVWMTDGGDYAGYLPFWIIFTLWSVWTVVTLIHGRAWIGIPHPRRIVAGAVVSALIAITNVTYTQIYIPYATSPLVMSSASFGKPSLDGERKKMYLPVHLYVKNSGQIPIYLLGSIYWLEGGPAIDPPRTDSPHRDLSYTLIHDGEFIKPPGRPLNPGQEFSEDEVIEFTLDKFKYEAVRVYTELYAIRKDRVTIVGDYERSGRDLQALKREGKDQDPKGPRQGYFRYQTEISNSNEILNVTRGRQRITLWYVDNKKKPYIYAVVAPPSERVDFDLGHVHANQEAIDRYGLEAVRSSITQKPFKELMEMAEAEPKLPEGESPTPPSTEAP
ncbi:hypothetical protein [Streptomyces sp. NBC_01296]|uniref:hypothetical protein n=1 Tax=Streptomyces sp. NBC_01296 TaxID=2903816 RepID=UPI002E138FCC|nr:hypothetical protein OG299_19965 [Streptomyces sp. NBC_01296]